jgi:hypothetical protein
MASVSIVSKGGPGYEFTEVFWVADESDIIGHPFTVRASLLSMMQGSNKQK